MTTVYLLADIEGAIGIWRRRQCHMGRSDWWKIGRPALTADVNSVIDGTRHGGASQIAVRDVHDRGLNLLVPQVHKTSSKLVIRSGCCGQHHRFF